MLPGAGEVRYLARPSANCRPLLVSVLRHPGDRVLSRPGGPFFGRQVDPILATPVIIFAQLRWHGLYIGPLVKFGFGFNVHFPVRRCFPDCCGARVVFCCDGFQEQPPRFQ